MKGKFEEISKFLYISSYIFLYILECTDYFWVAFVFH
ncbi:hypothetical protein OIU79_022177 [Salix purpurea]|uniref:Uncharacterized protein n=1 Tax=Salix purpurea TaxID=77065 RepID=A0A9Q0WF78_SALPP|nr:hypothetical protein OIU79_022177 [Salix purpurea]